jgi:hypothetical protein
MAYEQKTKQLKSDVLDYIDTIENEKKRDSSRELVKIMSEVTKMEPKLYTGNMIGFGSYHYKYESGHEGDSFIVGFAPRKANITLYVMGALLEESGQELIARLGKCKTSKGCIYINKIEDIDTKVLKEIVKLSVKHTKAKYPTK